MRPSESRPLRDTNGISNKWTSGAVFLGPFWAKVKTAESVRMVVKSFSF